MPGRYRDSHPWPFYALRITTPRLELRLPDDEDIVELFAAAQAGIHPAGEMPFGVPWTDSLQEPGAFERFCSFHWASRGAIAAEKWSLPFAVVSDGAIVGSAGARRRGLRRQPQRVQRLVADSLGAGPRARRRDARGRAAPRVRRARRARGADIGVDRQPRLPARLAASRLPARGASSCSRGAASPRAHLRYRLTREAWQQNHFDGIEIHALEPCLPFLGRCMNLQRTCIIMQSWRRRPHSLRALMPTRAR